MMSGFAATTTVTWILSRVATPRYPVVSARLRE